MPANISTVVDVTITTETTAVSRAGFGTILIVGSNANGTFDSGELVREYSSITEVAEDFSISDDEYKAANAAFAQDPSPETVKIGDQGTFVAEISTLVFNANLITGNSFNCTVNGTALGAVPFNTSNAQTLTDIATALQATSDIATAVSNGTDTITVTAAVAGIPIVLDSILVTGGASQATGIQTVTTDNYGYAEAIADITEQDNDWYGLVITSRTEGHVKQAAAYIEAVTKIFGTTASDSDILDATTTNDIANYFEGLNYDRTFVFYNETPTTFPEAAWMGRCFPENPGAVTFKFKTLSGITASDLTSTQRSNLLDSNCNVLTEIGGIDITEEGTMASGQFIDVIRDIDWLHSRLEEEVYDALVNNEKIPYTDLGVAIIEGKVRGVLENAIKVGVLYSYTLTVPLVADVSTVDRAARLLPDVTFTATLAGAIHRVTTINGTISV